MTTDTSSATPASEVVPAGTPGSRWVTASDNVQTTASWIIKTLAVVGGVIFGAGPVVARPEVDPVEHWELLLLAGLAGVAGVAGIGMLIWAASRMLLPVERTLGSLPPEFAAQIARNPRDFLPDGIDSLEAFRTRLTAQRRSTSSAKLMLARATAERDAIKEDPKPDPDTLKAKEAEVRVLADGAAARATTRELVDPVRDDILGRAKFYGVTDAFEVNRKFVFVGGALAAIGGIAFQLLLSSDPDEEAEASASARIGVLVKAESGTSDDLWRQVRLTNCERANRPLPSVPVLVHSGSGTPEDPYTVSTIPKASCLSRTFKVIDAVALVKFPPKREISITFTEAPSPSS